MESRTHKLDQRGDARHLSQLVMETQVHKGPDLQLGAFGPNPPPEESELFAGSLNSPRTFSSITKQGRQSQANSATPRQAGIQVRSGGGIVLFLYYLSY